MKTGTLRKVLVVLTVLAVAMALSVAPVFAAPKTPAQVSGLKVTQATNTSVSLSWKKAANAKKYEVKYKVSSAKKWKSLQTTAKKATVKKLKANTKYNFKVRGINATKKGKFSKTVTQKTFATPGKVDVKSIYASERTRNNIELSWKKVANASWYFITARSLNGDVYTPQQSTGTTYSFSHKTKPNTWYEYNIRAVNAKTGKFPAIYGAWSGRFYACTVSGDRVITGTVGSDGMIEYKMTGSKPFVIGEDDALIPENYIEQTDEYGTEFLHDELRCDAVSFPSDFDPLDYSQFVGPSELAGKTFKVGDTFDGTTITAIIFSRAFEDDYATYNSQVEIVGETSSDRYAYVW